MDLETHLKIIREQDFSRYELESALARYRQVVADVETCRAIEGDSVTILCDNPEAESADRQVAVELCVESTRWELNRFHAPTWQAALHAAAEHVRNTNPERNDP